MTRHLKFMAAVLALLVTTEARPLGQAGADAALVAKARAIHERVNLPNEIASDTIGLALTAADVTLELVRPGYTEEQIGKIWSRNLPRVLAEVENVAKQIQSGQK